MYIKKILWVIAVIGLLICGFIAYSIYNALFIENTNFDSKTKIVYIETGTPFSSLKEKMSPILKDIQSFEMVAKQKKYIHKIKPGRYTLKKGMNNNEIINTLRSKNNPIKISFNNQKNLADLAGRIAKQIEADSISLIHAFNEMDFLKENGFNSSTALGMYLPNSYQFYWNTNAQQFRAKMLKEFKRFWNKDQLQKAEKLNLTPHEITTLAAIVYEESKQKSEQPRVAGVYLNRLKINMPLQADPTLKYAAYQLPEYQGKVIKRILNKHKLIASPYNTYINNGLPPGPICMPDISAINAVLNAEKHSYLYFSADPERIGFHKFAKTLAQHNANAKKYHNYLNKQGIRR